MIKLPNDKVCYNLPEQVGVNAANIKYLAETYKNLDEIVATWPEYKAEWDQFVIDYAGWTDTLANYLTDMSSAAVSAIAGQNIAPANVAATASVSAPSITGGAIIEDMVGYSFSTYGTNPTGLTITFTYAGMVKNGNKLTLALAGKIQRSGTLSPQNTNAILFTIPQEVYDKLFETTISGNTLLTTKGLELYNTYSSHITVPAILSKTSAHTLRLVIYSLNSMTDGTEYTFRYEETFLLSDNLAA